VKLHTSELRRPARRSLKKQIVDRVDLAIDGVFVAGKKQVVEGELFAIVDQCEPLDHVLVPELHDRTWPAVAKQNLSSVDIVACAHGRNPGVLKSSRRVGEQKCFERRWFIPVPSLCAEKPLAVTLARSGVVADETPLAIGDLRHGTQHQRADNDDCDSSNGDAFARVHSAVFAMPEITDVPREKMVNGWPTINGPRKRFIESDTAVRNDTHFVELRSRTNAENVDERSEREGHERRAPQPFAVVVHVFGVYRAFPKHRTCEMTTV
jgi:hypothetical protein